MLLTDGQQTRGGDYIEPAIAALLLKKIGVRVYAVGIGRGAKRSELEVIADSKDNVYMLSNFLRLRNRDFISKFAFGCHSGTLVTYSLQMYAVL